jgi:PAS domain S-box-containing protein
VAGNNLSLPPAIDALGISRALLASSRDAIVVADGRARITMMNRAAEQATGWRTADACGRRIGDVCRLVAVSGDSIPPVFSGDPFRVHSPVDLDGAADEDSEEGFDRCAMLHPRTGPPVRVAHRAIWVPAIDGSTDGAVLVLRLQLDEEDALLGGIRRREYCRRILEAEPACVKVVGPDGTLVDMNAAGLAMLEADSLAQAQRRPLIEFIAPAHRSSFGALHRTVMQGQSGALEFEIVGLRGTARWLETQAVPLRDSTGRVAALLGATHDITERRRADQALRDSERRY